jgi:hypothetical protein
MLPQLILVAMLAQAFQTSFPVDPATLATEGEGPYFVLTPGFQATYAGASGRLVITVLDETKDVGGVRTRVVEEREWKGAELVEVSRNYLAFDPATKDVYYFGEDVDAYKHGKVVNHDGSWRYGANGATFGLMMPGTPAVGMKFYQEQAKGVAMDRAEIVSVTERATMPAGRFDRCVKTRETTPLEPLSREYKLYAPGVGLIVDGDMKLVAYKNATTPKAPQRTAILARSAWSSRSRRMMLYAVSSTSIVVTFAC